MPDYQFSWFRDGAFIAYALTLDGIHNMVPHRVGMSGQWDSTLKFHQWSARIINERAGDLERTIQRAALGQPLILADTLNARYQDGGTAGPADWPNDGDGILGVRTVLQVQADVPAQRYTGRGLGHPPNFRTEYHPCYPAAG
jgi:hypothetical protein